MMCAILVATNPDCKIGIHKHFEKRGKPKTLPGKGKGKAKSIISTVPSANKAAQMGDWSKTETGPIERQPANWFVSVTTYLDFPSLALV